MSIKLPVARKKALLENFGQRVLDFDTLSVPEDPLELYRKGIAELSEMLGKHETSAKEIAISVFDRIEQVEGRIKAYLTLTKDEALSMAEKADLGLSAGTNKNLSGIPIAIKDNMCTKGILTTCASKILQNFIPPYESTATSKLLEQGYVLIGKTNLDEFAMGSSTENQASIQPATPGIRKEYLEVQAAVLLLQLQLTNALLH